MIKQLKPLDFCQQRMTSLIPDMDQHFYLISELLLQNQSKDKGDDFHEDFMISCREHLSCQKGALVDVYAFWNDLPAKVKTVFFYLSVSPNKDFPIHQHQVLLEILDFLDHISLYSIIPLSEVVLTAALDDHKSENLNYVKIKRKHSFGGLLYRDWYQIS